MYKTLVEAVLAHGAETPDREAVAFKDTVLTYGELCRRTRVIARRLRDEYGVKRGGRVALSAVSRPDYIAALLAVQYLGGAVLPLDKTAKAAAVERICAAARPKLIFTDAKAAGAGNWGSLKDLYGQSAGEEIGPYEPPPPGDTGEILFTTGTTGEPKGAMLTYESLAANMANTWYGVGMRESDRILLPLPLNHSYGMRVLRSALWGGAAVVLQNGFTFAKELEINIEKHGCTALAGVPASIELIRRQMGERFAGIIGKLRYIEIAAGALPIDLRKKLLRELPNTQLHNTWGSTETGGALFLNLTERPDKMTSAGKPLDGIELKVLDPDGRTVEARDAAGAGRMALRGRMQMSGYCGMAERTGETIVDGWLLTNDLVYTDEDGYVYMIGRADDIINVGGEKVSPVEIEWAAQEYDNVRECACIGVDDPDGVTGMAPVLYLVPEAGYSGAELSKYLSSRLERYKLPKRCIPLEALPRNQMEKIDRRALRQMWRESGDRPLTNEVIRCIMGRRSVRDFTEEPVPRTLLEVITQAGIQAPSGHNMQTWRFTVLRGQESIRRLRSVTGKAAKEKKVYFYGFNNPQAVILVSNDRRNRYGVQDSSCAAENMMLAAHSLGLGSVWINALSTIGDEPEVRKLLDEYHIPASHTIIAAVALGWPKSPGKALAKKQDAIVWAD